ncbi:MULTISPECIES: hypothetical protein [Streptomyces]|uniref:Uncharacterized protein n=2 Tax=Streptomyces venezuelae TaxID=54571 RepID=F2RL21_STRVP|nr:hypothetical protein [Streptomyces venezuelae]APE21389.1 hypothetical protein vnz_10385 [Streptomyces venezuelae]QER98780.1 hypothetical protein DEJ43_10525 [Streptomyces venezuelae ATCC 10712]CCA55410.1 hypothetical protein SVEN_2124 [Streptomyces venezuelae ATCC 10712]
MKTTYHATRGDKKALCRDAKPGTPLYVIHDHVAIKGEPSTTYTEWIVTDDTMPFTGNRIAQNPTSGATIPVPSLLAQERAVHTARPAGIPNRAAMVTHETYSAAAHQAAQKVANKHAEDAAKALIRRYAGSR